jgi:DNA-3-methyladenine glycosylase
MRFKRKFFERSADIVARELLGSLVCRRIRQDAFSIGQVVETEAYLGEKDLASHASRGRTPRTETMYGPAGHAYVYLVYGMHWMFNVVTGPEGEAGAVLIRAIEPVKVTRPVLAPGPSLQTGEAWPDTSGPGKLTKWFQIDGRFDRVDLVKGGELWLEKRQGQTSFDVARSRRVGVDYAGVWAEKQLRFYVSGNRYVSRK